MALEIVQRRQHYLQDCQKGVVPRRRHLAYISEWAVAFVAMSATA